MHIFETSNYKDINRCVSFMYYVTTCSIEISELFSAAAAVPYMEDIKDFENEKGYRKKTFTKIVSQIQYSKIWDSD